MTTPTPENEPTTGGDVTEPVTELVEEAYAQPGDATVSADLPGDAPYAADEAAADAAAYPTTEDEAAYAADPGAGYAGAGYAQAFVERPIQTTGRRKEAIVRVRLVPGSGQWKLNGRTLEQYFPNKVHQQLVNEPFVTLERADQFDVIALLRGGGVSGQAGALRLGIARALVELDGENRPPLKRAGFLTRDARVKERKKYGLKKARKAPQYSKR